jgi:hypothetical protein
MQKKIVLFSTIFFLSLSATVTGAQTSRRKLNTSGSSVPQKNVERAEKPLPVTPAPAKKNNRAVNEDQPPDNLIRNNNAAQPFVYEYVNPQFVIQKVIIAHDANGKGAISYQKQNLPETLTDPLEISAASLKKISDLWNALDFVNSAENYQSAKYDYPHLGTMKLMRRDGERKREAIFNYTENETARKLTDEYKKITEQFIWISEMNTVRENQPLNAPQMLDRIDILLKRGEVSDTEQVAVYLRAVAGDERLPLIARNHATKLIHRIEKQKKE